jgi:hypothetical protein
MGAAGYSGGADGAEDGARRDADVDEIVKAVVDDGVRVVDCKELGRGWSVRVFEEGELQGAIVPRRRFGSRHERCLRRHCSRVSAV